MPRAEVCKAVLSPRARRSPQLAPEGGPRPHTPSLTAKGQADGSPSLAGPSDRLQGAGIWKCWRSQTVPLPRVRGAGAMSSADWKVHTL